MSETLKDKMIQALVDLKHITKEDLDSAIMLQKQKCLSLDKILIEKGLILEKELMENLLAKIFYQINLD